MPRVAAIAGGTGIIPRFARQNIANFRRFASGMKRARKIRAGGFCKRWSKLIAEHPRAHLFDRACRELAELKWSERKSNQAVDLEPNVFEHTLDLAILAFA